MNQMDLAWKAEEVALNVRPSPIEIHYEGWLIRASGGPVRRTNSICPTRHRSKDFVPILDAAEAIFRSLQRPSIVKVISIADEADDLLERRGYAKEGESKVLFSESNPASSESTSVEVSAGGPDRTWIDAWSKIGKHSSRDSVAAFSRSMEVIVLPKAFAAYRLAGQIVAIAYGIIHRDVLGVDAVATMPEHRGYGYARQVVSSLQDWARHQGVQSACLSVLADNAAALALYRRCGFNRHLYSYHYRASAFAKA